MPRKLPFRPDNVLDANQVVAYNFHEARKLRGWTQEQTAAELSRHSGTLLKKASISSIETSFTTERRRVFTAQDIAEFALTFDLPLLWFFIPPEGTKATLAGTNQPVERLWPMTFGSNQQQTLIENRLRLVVGEDPHAASDDIGKYRAQWATVVQDQTREHTSDTLLIIESMRTLIARHEEALDADIHRNYAS